VGQQGKTSITPIVTKAETAYDGSDAGGVIRFQTGDKVTIEAGGGVQTGGHGTTWKRYVNPIGDNHDKMYYGTIYIPGITTGGLTPIRDLVGPYGEGKYDSQKPDQCTLHLTIPDISSLPESARYLRLGYVDDNYTDNGYWGHDDGDEDQCKGVGPAYVKITIEHAAPAVVATSPAPPAVKVDYIVGAGIVEPVERGVYGVSFTASSSGFQDPVSYAWILDPATPSERHLSGQNVYAEFVVSSPNGPYTYDHDVAVIASSDGAQAEATIHVSLPTPTITARPDYTTATYNIIKPGPGARPAIGHSVPVSVIFQHNGVYVQFLIPFFVGSYSNNLFRFYR
jgi:hypothetical protein